MRTQNVRRIFTESNRVITRRAHLKRSPIRRKDPCISTGAQTAKTSGCAMRTIMRGQKSQTAFARIAKKTKKKTPIRSKPYEGALDKRSHWTASGNLKLFGKDKSAMRERIFSRAGGRCEEQGKLRYGVEGMPQHAIPFVRCTRAATEWSHKPCIHIKAGSGHGQGFKCDAAECGIASCTACHQKAHGSY